MPIHKTFRPCIICGEQFFAVTAKYCSTDCYKKELNYRPKQRATASAWRRTTAGYLSRWMEKAKSTTPDTDLTKIWLSEKLSKGICELTGLPFDTSRDTGYTRNPRVPSIDRIDSSRGYYKDNVQLIFSWLNIAKNEYSMATFLELFTEAAPSLTGNP